MIERIPEEISASFLLIDQYSTLWEIHAYTRRSSEGSGRGSYHFNRESFQQEVLTFGSSADSPRR